MFSFHTKPKSPEPESLNRRIHLSTSLTLPLVLPCDRFHNLLALLLCPDKHLIAHCLLLLIPQACPSPDLKNYYSSIPKNFNQMSVPYVSQFSCPIAQACYSWSTRQSIFQRKAIKSWHQGVITIVCVGCSLGPLGLFHGPFPWAFSKLLPQS